MQNIKLQNLFDEGELSKIAAPRRCADDRIITEHIRRKNNASKNFLTIGARRTGKYGMPVLAPCHTQSPPESALSFSKAHSLKPERVGLLHFLEDDYKFERVWNNPRKYLTLLKKPLFVIEPDFSIKIGMEIPDQIYNLRRNLSLAYWMQSKGIKVIPLACWSDTMSSEWCFDGMPDGGTIAVSMTGAMGNDLSRQAFWRGLEEMFRRITPDRVWLFGLHKNSEVEEYISSICDVDFISTNYHGK